MLRRSAIFALICFAFRAQAGSSAPTPEPAARANGKVAAEALAAPARAPAPSASFHRSLVRISVTAQTPNWRVPWNPGSVGSGVGAGFVISGSRVLTNAHVVSNARFIALDREGDPKRYIARVEHIAHDCDLATLTVNDPAFFEGTSALELGGIPELQSTVAAFGYPIGGDRLSVTQGVVSRIDFQGYSHSGADAHLAIQIDAAINPGNSGGPVMQAGKVVGVAFQGYSGDVAQNVGYMIPTPVVRRFLKDIEDGSYDHYVDLALDVFPLQNPAMRRALGLKDDDRGVLVGRVPSASCAHGLLLRGDVLLAVDGLPVASDGFVEMDGERVEMPEIVERKFKGDKVVARVLRDGKTLDVEITLDGIAPYLMSANRYDVLPEYLIFAGLVFQPLSRNFIDAWNPDDLRLRYIFDAYITEEFYDRHPEVIVLSAVLPDPVNTYLERFRNGILDKINGKTIRTLRDAAAAFDEKAERYVIEMVGGNRPIVLHADLVAEAAARIRERYHLVEERRIP